MNQVMLAYAPILIFLILAIVLSCVLSFLPLLINKREKTAAKLSRYECGFDAFDSPRKKFDVRFYLIAMLFIIFDLEIAFLFPWAIVLKKISIAGFFSMMMFLFILTVGFVYEWRKGALEWE